MDQGNIFEQGSISKVYFSLALPVTLSMVFSVVYNVADTWFIAQTQNTQLVAGVSLCAPVFMLLMAFGNIFGQGGSSLISRLYGQKDFDGTRRISSFCFWAAIATGIVLGALMLVFANPILRLLGASPDTIGYAREYFVTLAWGAPFLVANFIHMNLLRAEGMSRESMIGSTSGLVVNIILDPVFILGFHWGAFGAAFASVLGYVFSDVFLFVIVLKKSRVQSVRPNLARIAPKDVGQIFAIGTSAALTNIMSSICLVVLNQYLLPFGDDRIAAMGIAQKVSMIILLILTGMSFGASPMVGYYYGGRQYGRLKELLGFLLRTVGGTAIVMTAVLFALARPAIGMFLKDAAIIALGTQMLRWQIVTVTLATAVMIITICFQASGKAPEALIVSVLRQGIVFLAVIAVLSKIAGYQGILASQASADIVTVMIAGTMFWKRFYRMLGE